MQIGVGSQFNRWRDRVCWWLLVFGRKMGLFVSNKQTRKQRWWAEIYIQGFWDFGGSIFLESLLCQVFACVLWDFH
jgi:hypothetical protein